MDQTKWPVLDAAFSAFEPEAHDEDGRLMLKYSMFMHQAWRTVLQMLAVSPTWAVLDVGTGYGILPLELAGQLPMRVHGIDIVPEYVEGAGLIRDRLAAEGYLQPGSEVTFEAGDICDLPCDDASYDFVMVREVLQFLSDPTAATRELARVLRPGGYACVSDTDDGLYINYPPPSEAFAHLLQAFTEMHAAAGGDRQTGRKLSSYLRASGFDIASVVVLPEARHELAGAGEVEHGFVIDQLREARKRVIDAGVMTAEEFDADFDRVVHEPPVERFHLNGRIIVIGHKPA